MVPRPCLTILIIFMPHDINLIAILVAGFGLALVFGYLAARLKLPPLVGYLLAGILIGPQTPGFVGDLGLALQLSEIGVMLLMFGVGLHFSLSDLMAVRRLAIPGAIIQIGLATMLGMGLGLWWDLSVMGSLVFGLSLSVASTVVLLRSLEARGLLLTADGKIAVGWLVVEDLVMVLMLVLLPVVAGLASKTDGPGVASLASSHLWLSLGLTFVKLAGFVVLMLVVGKRVLPWMLDKVAQTGSRELFTLCVIVAALGTAFLAAAVFDVSFALGAFVAGMMLRESDLSHRAAEESLPLRDAFAVLFFVSVGMLFDPTIVIREPGLLILTVFLVMIGKTVIAGGLVLLSGYSLRTALVVSASLAQIGEFSFILAGMGVAMKLIDQEVYSVILAAAFVSIALNVALMDGALKIADSRDA
jgi:monovalent cation:H+ antiporter-2, CPA2 family